MIHHAPIAPAHTPAVVLLAACHHREWWPVLAAARELNGSPCDSTAVASGALAGLTGAEKLRLRHLAEQARPVQWPRHRVWLDQVLGPVGGSGGAL